MIPFETIKQNLSLVEVAQDFGLDVGRSSMARCPFHDDHSPSLYIADDHYHCYGCGAHGDVIDFTARLFDLSLQDAAGKLAADYRLNPGIPPSASVLDAKHQKAQQRQQEALQGRWFTDLNNALKTLKQWQIEFAPKAPDMPLDERFVTSCKEIPRVEYLLDRFLVADLEERRAIVQNHPIRMEVKNHVSKAPVVGR